jgi:HSP20 family protein
MKPSLYANYTPMLRGFFDDFFRPVRQDQPEDNFMTMPAVNIKETDGNFHLEVASPGLKKDDFKIDVEKGVLTISAQKEQSEQTKEDNYTRREFRYASFKRSFQLPEGIKEEDIQATYQDGVLIIDLPKKEVSMIETARKIAVK